MSSMPHELTPVTLPPGRAIVCPRPMTTGSLHRQELRRRKAPNRSARQLWIDWAGSQESTSSFSPPSRHPPTGPRPAYRLPYCYTCLIYMPRLAKSLTSGCRSGRRVRRSATLSTCSMRSESVGVRSPGIKPRIDGISTTVIVVLAVLLACKDQGPHYRPRRSAAICRSATCADHAVQLQVVHGIVRKTG